MKTTLLAATILLSIGCKQQDPDKGKITQVQIYSYGKLIKVDTAYGWIEQNGYNRTITYTNKRGGSVSAKSDYILVPLN